jgi:hypothetical protein
MLFSKTRGLAWLTAVAALAGSASPASAQLFNQCNSCAQTAAVSYQAPMAYSQTASAAGGTYCVPQVSYVCYRNEPKTVMQEVRQVVRKPEYKTVMQDQQFTTYQTQYEQRTAQVSQVNYQPVTEYQQRCVDMGQWQTWSECRPKISSCQYDNRPTFMGWMNRTGHSIRNTFTPSVVSHRQYVPNMVAQQIPVTRMVAIPSTKEVAYTVAKQVPITQTRQVAVQVVEWKEEVQVAQVPVTTYEMKPYGTQTANGFIPWNTDTTRTATGPTPDPNFSRSAEGNTNKPTDTSLRPIDQRSGMLQPAPAPRPAVQPASHNLRGSMQASNDGYRLLNKDQINAIRSNDAQQVAVSVPQPAPRNELTQTPSIVQATGWKARTLKANDDGAGVPVLTQPNVEVAANK